MEFTTFLRLQLPALSNSVFAPFDQRLGNSDSENVRFSLELRMLSSAPCYISVLIPVVGIYTYNPSIRTAIIANQSFSSRSFYPACVTGSEGAILFGVLKNRLHQPRQSIHIRSCTWITYLFVPSFLSDHLLTWNELQKANKNGLTWFILCVCVLAETDPLYN